MSSTGEVGCIGDDFSEALLTSMISVGYSIPKKAVMVSSGDTRSKVDLLDACKMLQDNGYEIYATGGTEKFLAEHGVKAERVAFISEPFFRYSKWKGGADTLSAEDRQVIESLVAKSHKTGKPIRFWGSPDTVNAWETFRELGIDIINTDRPEACTLYFQEH